MLVFELVGVHRAPRAPHARRDPALPGVELGERDREPVQEALVVALAILVARVDGQPLWTDALDSRAHVLELAAARSLSSSLEVVSARRTAPLHVQVVGADAALALAILLVPDVVRRPNVVGPIVSVASVVVLRGLEQSAPDAALVGVEDVGAPRALHARRRGVQRFIDLAPLLPAQVELSLAQSLDDGADADAFVHVAPEHAIRTDLLPVRLTPMV